MLLTKGTKRRLPTRNSHDEVDYYALRLILLSFPATDNPYNVLFLTV